MPLAAPTLRSVFRYRAVTVTLIVGTLLSIAGAIALRQDETNDFQSNFAIAADRRVRAVRRQIEGDLSALNALRGFMEVPRPVTASDFAQFSGRLLESHPSLLAVEWVSHVRGAAERRDFEAEMRRNGMADSGITERRPGAGRLAADRDEYWAVRLLAPMNEANRRAIGYDLGSCANCRKALAAAASTGQPATMDRLNILERPGYTEAVVLPVFQGFGAEPGAREPWAYAMVLLHVGVVIESGLQPLEPQGIRVQVYDGDPHNPLSFLYDHPSRFEPANATASTAPQTGLHYSSGIAVGNHTWTLLCTPTAASLAASKSWWPWVFCACGMMLTMGVAGYFHTNLAHAEQSAILLQDLTERTNRLKESEDRMRQILAGAMDAIITTDADGAITGWNPRAEKIFGYNAAEAVGRNLPELIIPEAQRDLHAQALKHLLATGEGNMLQRLVERTAARRDGVEFPVEMIIVPVMIGGAQQFCLFIRDITERKHLQAQLMQAQKMESIGQLAGGIAHDFNNLLTVISGAAQLAEWNGDQGISPSKDLAAIRTAAARATSLTQQILAYSRKQILQPTIVDLNALVSQVGAMIQRVIGEEITVSLQAGENLWPVQVDRGQFEQVILNMAINARDAMPEGGRLIICTRNTVLRETEPAEQGLTAGDYVELAVSDTGIGMDERTLHSIFDPFFTTKPEGTGLGLSMAYGLIKQSNGDIRVTSKEGQGTTFTILLPRAKSEAGAQTTASPAADVSQGRETILVVEDEDLVRDLVRDVLASIGYTVCVAANGHEALTLLDGDNGRHIDLVLSDVIMPEMNGRVLAQQIKIKHPETKILFTSGYTGDSVGLRKELGERVPFIQKPYDLEHLARKVREVLDAD